MSGFLDGAAGGVTATHADYVVVGSGAGGGAAARVLAASGRSVVVLEEGPRVTRHDVGPLAHGAMTQLLRHGGQMAAFGRSAVPVIQGRCVGGTTFVNSAIIWRLPEKIVARWHQEFGLADALPEAALADAYDTLEREMLVRPVHDGIATGSDRLMRLGGERTGLDHRTIRRSEDGCQGSGRCFMGCPHDAKQSTTINYLRRAVEDGASVFSNAKVERVVVEGGRATAVTGTSGGKRFRVAARKAVVVSASVVQSPNLLRRSGLALDNDALGNHFTAHPGTTVVGLYPDKVGMWTGASQGYEVHGMRDTLGVKFESINVPPEVAASRLPGAGRRFAKYLDRLPHMAAWAAALRADAEGTVRPSRLFGGDIIRFTPTSGDLDRLRQGLKKLGELHFLAGATEVIPNVHGMPDVLTSPDQLGLFDQASLDPQAYSLVATHLFGTCRAGPDARTSVVDPQLRVHGVAGLYVMDASVFPTNTGVNPQHSIMAVALVAARRLAAA